MLQKVDIQQKFKFLKIRFRLVKGSKSNIVFSHCGPKTSFRPRIDPSPHSNHHHHHYHLPPLTPTTTTSTTTTQEANQTSSLSESFPLYYQLLQYVQSSVFPRNKHFLLNYRMHFILTNQVDMQVLTRPGIWQVYTCSNHGQQCSCK